MRTIRENRCKHVKFNELLDGDLFYNVITENIYLKIPRDSGHNNAVNLDLACLTEFTPNHDVIVVREYKFQYMI